LIEECFAFGQGGGKVDGSYGLSAGWTREKKGVGEVGGDCGHVALCRFAGVEGEEARDGSFECEH